MKLDQLQQDFISAIFNKDRNTALNYISKDSTLSPEKRLGIYRGSVHGILTKALGENFPVCKTLLGETFFDKMCDKFIDKHPPDSAFFSLYGEGLADFLHTFEPVSEIPYISDVARFEWYRHHLSLETAPNPFDFSKIAELTESQQASLTFQIIQTLRLFKSRFRIDLIWFAHQQDSDISLEKISSEELLTPMNLFMWKSNREIKISLVDQQKESSETTNDEIDLEDLTSWNFLYKISKNSSLTDLAEEFGEDFPILLNKSIIGGWIQSFTCV